MKSRLTYYCIAFLLCVVTRSQASHIVGGDLTYKRITKDSFRIELVIYIDCKNGMAGAIADDHDAMIGVFDSSGSEVKRLLEERTGPDSINSVNYDCVIPPAGACVTKYVYTYYTTLPPIPGGYTLVFQRCCRNITIKNLQSPNAVGATYWTVIPDTTGIGYNSSAKFDSLPPNYICVNRLFSYKHSATDPDGDSLAYELYTPFNGANSGPPQPRPPQSPPYQKVPWLAPYQDNNMMGGNPKLFIDPHTGQLTVTPDITGQFVVGISVKEYRRGRLISTTRRDFQFNVMDCAFEVVSAFTPAILTCSDTVRFSNKSTGATYYSWDFGISSSDGDTSTAFSPEYIYPGKGKYTVRLISSIKNCRDTSLSSVIIFRDTASFSGISDTICKGDTIRLGVTDTSNLFLYKWVPPQFLNSEYLPAPTAKPLNTITYRVIRSYLGCQKTDSVTVTVSEIKVDFDYTKEEYCDDVHLQFLSTSKNTAAYQWKIDDVPIALTETFNAVMNYDKQATVTLIANNNVCIDTLEKKITLHPSDSITFIPDVFTPDHSETNDCYMISHARSIVDCAETVIYNRWGTVVYDSKKDGTCWDGKANGTDASEGTYYYIIRSKGSTFHGTVTLVR